MSVKVFKLSSENYNLRLERPNYKQKLIWHLETLEQVLNIAQTEKKKTLPYTSGKCHYILPHFLIPVAMRLTQALQRCILFV